MPEAAESVDTGEVTKAVRDTASDAGPIVTGDWIGLVRGDGMVVGQRPRSRERSSACSISWSTRSASTIITVGEGADGGTTDRRSRRGWPSERPGSRSEVHDGGQPLYPYLLGVGVTREPPRVAVHRSRLRELAEIDVDRLKGVGEKKRAASAGRHRHRPRPADDLPAALGRPHERGASPISPGNEALVLVTVRSVTKRMTRNRRTMVDGGRR